MVDYTERERFKLTEAQQRRLLEGADELDKTKSQYIREALEEKYARDVEGADTHGGGSSGGGGGAAAEVMGALDSIEGELNALRRTTDSVDDRMATVEEEVGVDVAEMAASVREALPPAKPESKTWVDRQQNIGYDDAAPPKSRIAWSGTPYAVAEKMNEPVAETVRACEFLRKNERDVQRAPVDGSVRYFIAGPSVDHVRHGGGDF